MPFLVQRLYSLFLMRRDALVMSGVFTPTPAQNSFRPPPDPVASITGVLNLELLPNRSATTVANGYTVDEPTMRTWSRATAWPAAPTRASAPTVANVTVCFTDVSPDRWLRVGIGMETQRDLGQIGEALRRRRGNRSPVAAPDPSIVPPSQTAAPSALPVTPTLTTARFRNTTDMRQICYARRVVGPLRGQGAPKPRLTLPAICR